ncbi:amino acid ABC transporter substrate-binding protein [Leeia aquatica]|uniref:Amino acid ABC transporter substrate-binding protein n=1 Tax=Leeia aquatica TaxID=2725557 RepID=A0A847S2L2_9NEIS|nr:amino acid ABC transporter substrate-binding protein [Leeia aquatica]NLR74023.1 amino acid ABC transporter substrate-binding protein [Leeia aquatica]
MKSRLTRIALATTLLISAPAFAQDALAQIKAAGVLKIGTEGTYAPFTYHLPSGELTGFDVEIAQAVAKKLGVKAQFVEGKWDGLIAGLDVNRYDVVVNEVTITDARKAKYDFSQPYILSKPVLIVASNNSSIKSFADLKGKKSAHTLSSNFAKQAQSFGAEVVGTDGFEQSVALVLTGRADATINDSLSFLDFKKKKPDAQVKVVATSKDAEASGILLRKGNPELLAAINKALAELKQDGSYLKLSQKYFGEDVSQ